MAIVESETTFETHEVVNQPPPLQDYNVFTSDTVLVEALKREGAAWAEQDVTAFGAKVGSAEFFHFGYLANRHVPELHAHDRFGHRIDEVWFHPAYHELMRVGMEAEIHALPWNHRRPGAHVARAAKYLVFSQAEPGPGCPLTMTFAATPCLRLQPEVAEEWIPRITSTQYDPRVVPAVAKTGCTMGMAMTEKQGGSDVRANTARAIALGIEGPGQEYYLVGHKWFVSGTMGDAFLMTANTEKGLCCFFVPWWRPDGTRNALRLQKIKDKLGNRSNATCEMELCNAWGRMIGEETHGVRTIMEMVTHTRLDCTIGTASIMRAAVSQAIHHTSHREAFGAMLSSQPLMRNVLADIALESEAATILMMRLAHLYDRAEEDPKWKPLVRLATAVCKYWVCKRGPNMVYEALECHGGDGYIEDGPMPRLYREAVVSSVWEGSGNVICLDVLKTIVREPASVPAFLEEVGKAKGADRRFDAFYQKIEAELANTQDAEMRGRRIVDAMAVAYQASLLVQHAPPCVSDAFCAARLEDGDRGVYGALPPDTQFERIIERAAPKTD